jgi:hypothetical protein
MRGAKEYEEFQEYKEFGGRRLGLADDGVFQAIKTIIKALDFRFERLTQRNPGASIAPASRVCHTLA